MTLWPADPGVLNSVMGIVRAYLRLAVGLVDEVILAHGIRNRAENPFGSAKEALVLYAQNGKPIDGQRGLAHADHLGCCRSSSSS